MAAMVYSWQLGLYRPSQYLCHIIKGEGASTLPHRSTFAVFGPYQAIYLANAPLASLIHGNTHSASGTSRYQKLCPILTHFGWSGMI